MRHLDISNWTDGRTNGLVRLAENIEKEYPKQHIVAVGQSPAWMVYTLGLLREAEGKPSDTTLLSFSGNFLSRSGSQFLPNASKYPDSTRLHNYFNYLTQEKSTPRDILDRYKNDPMQKTVFFDFMFDGEGFPSFVHLLTTCDKWLNQTQKSRLMEACVFHELRGSKESISPFSEMDFFSENGIDVFSVPLVSNKDMNDDLHYSFSGKKGEEEGHIGSDRLVPSFDISAQGQGKLLPTNNEARQNLIKAKIKDAVAQHVRRRRVLSVPKKATALFGKPLSL
jgi:hypothetical protein